MTKDAFQPRLAAVPVFADIPSSFGKAILLLRFGRAHFSSVSLLGRLESRFALFSCYLFLRLCLCQPTVDLTINLFPFCQAHRGFVCLLYCSAGRLAFAFCCIPSDLCCCQTLLTPPLDDAPFFVLQLKVSSLNSQPKWATEDWAWRALALNFAMASLRSFSTSLSMLLMRPRGLRWL